MIDLEKEINESFIPLLYDQSRHLILKGTAGSGKSVFASQKITLRCLDGFEGGHHFLAFRKVQNTLKQSLIARFKKQISDWKLINRVHYYENKSEMYIELSNSRISFLGMDDPEKLKSIEGASGAILEELSEFTADDYDQINTRIRGKTPFYKQIIGMLNPIDEDLWVKKRFFDQVHDNTTTHSSNYLDNKFIDEEYKGVLEGYKDTNPLHYQVYCLGDWGIVNPNNKFLFAFSKDHIKKGLKFDPKLPVRFAFDFNIDPFTVSIYQKIDSRTVRIFDKIRLDNSDIYQVCDRIKAKYPRSIYFVTGDASGLNRTGMVRGTTSYWKIIRTELGLKDSQVRVRPRNLAHEESRVICNAALNTCNIEIDESMTELINDCKYAKVDVTGKLIKDRNENKNDWLDGFRYLLDIEFYDLVGRKHRK